MYKMLLEKKLALSDMESVDSEFYNSVKYILDNDPEPLCLAFTANREFLGKVNLWLRQLRKLHVHVHVHVRVYIHVHVHV